MLKNNLTVFFGIFLVSMLFIPPSIPSMIPEAFAIQDKGDFKLQYGTTTNYTEFESWVKSTQYFESQVAFLNTEFRLPHDVTVWVIECGKDIPAIFLDDVGRNSKSVGKLRDEAKKE